MNREAKRGNVSDHTPTPWTLNSGYNKIGAPVFEIKDVEGFTLLAVRGGVIPTSRDAEFIIRAVNSHEALLEAAKDLLNKLTFEGVATTRKQRIEAERKLRSVIAQATGHAEEDK